MKHFVVDNQCYQTVENMPMVNQDGADYTAKVVGTAMRDAIMSGTVSKIGGLLVRRRLAGLRHTLSPEHVLDSLYVSFRG